MDVTFLGEGRAGRGAPLWQRRRPALPLPAASSFSRRYVMAAASSMHATSTTALPACCSGCRFAVAHGHARLLALRVACAQDQTSDAGRGPRSTLGAACGRNVFRRRPSLPSLVSCACLRFSSRMRTHQYRRAACPSSSTMSRDEAREPYRSHGRAAWAIL